jgi:hypothetical protein
LTWRNSLTRLVLEQLAGNSGFEVQESMVLRERLAAAVRGWYQQCQPSTASWHRRNADEKPNALTDQRFINEEMEAEELRSA